MFAVLEALPPISLSIALLLAIAKAVVLFAAFHVKTYINTRNILLALFFILTSKVIVVGNWIIG